MPQQAPPITPAYGPADDNPAAARYGGGGGGGGGPPGAARRLPQFQPSPPPELRQQPRSGQAYHYTGARNAASYGNYEAYPHKPQDSDGGQNHDEAESAEVDTDGGAHAADDAWSESLAKGGRKNKTDKGGGGVFEEYFLLLNGLLMFTIVIILPIWDVSGLLYDSTFVFFVGRGQPILIIVLCLLSIVVFLGVMIVLQFFGREETKTEQTFMMIFSVMTTLIGIMLLMASGTLSDAGQHVAHELVHNCAAGPHTHRLYEFSTVLQNMRHDPVCRQLMSVEMCDGYEDSPPYTAFLKDLERRSKCSGFCYTTGTAVAATANASSLLQGRLGVKVPGSGPSAAAATAAAAGRRPKGTLSRALLRLAGQRIRDRDGGGGSASEKDDVSLLGLSRKVGTAHADSYALSPPLSEESAFRYTYPPTLFNNANYQVTCEGQAARELRMGAIETAQLIYEQGLCLVITAVVVWFLQMMGMCVMHPLWGSEPIQEKCNDENAGRDRPADWDAAGEAQHKVPGYNTMGEAQPGSSVGGHYGYHVPRRR